MYRKLDNNAWDEYLSRFISVNDTIKVENFCVENNLNKSKFYYQKRRLEKITQGKEPIFK